MKKTLILTMIALCAMMLRANDSWYKYPVFSDCIDQVLETSNKVYYVSNGSLFSYSPSDSESYAYSSINSLSDEDVARLYYNPEKDYVLVAYSNSNIDLILNSGKIVNMPDIKDSALTLDKTINDVAFGEGRIVVATNFGIVIFDDERYEVVESGIYEKPITTVGVMNGHVLIYGNRTTSYSVMASPLSMRHNTLDKFHTVGGWGITYLLPIDDEYLLFVDLDERKIFRRKIDFGKYSWTKADFADDMYLNSKPVRNKAGWCGVGDDKVYAFTATGVFSQALPAQLRGKQLSYYDDNSKVWTGDSLGISRHDISSGTPTTLVGSMLHQGCITDKRVGYMRWSADGERLYISNLENSGFRSYRNKEGSTVYQTTNVIERGEPRDVSLKNASADHVYARSYQERYNNRRMYGDPMWIIEDPDDHDKYYCADYFEGLYVIKRNPSTGEYEEIAKFTEENSPIVSNWGQRVLDVNIDAEGNLWMGHQHGEIYSVLPAQKRKADPATITKADWKTYTKLSGLSYAARDLTSLICKKSNMVFVLASAYEKGFIAIDTKGTYDNPADDKVMLWSRVVDQDGNNVQYMYITFMIEDARGCVWIGTNAGIFEITDPSKATDANMTVRRIKVPRNDGTNYADYLLDADMINWIAVDPADRKWVATDASGIFLVSETGDEIIRSYDTTNSPLPSNTVCTIECDPADNTVYVGTTQGLYSFKSDASAGQQDYSEIYAYPNPVRPEYSGQVTITGLMDNSVVKITDAAGALVCETRSEGGMATWDCCYRTGERVRSGVYYVYASSNNSGTTSGAVTKILVIN